MASATGGDYHQIVEEMEEETRNWKNALPSWKYQLGSDEPWDVESEGIHTKDKFFQDVVVEGFEGKRIFVCCDGTWQNASGTFTPMTNVAKIARAVDRTGHDDYGKPPGNERQGFVRQIVYYSPEIGTQSSLPFDRRVSAATGKGLNNSILSAYCFICNNYNFGSTADEIILVGFSRGAFTVRCLAHFISTVGLLRRKGLQFLRTLFSAWKRWVNARTSEREGYKEQLDDKLSALHSVLFSGVRIKVLAEWDTVSALGLPLGVWKEKYSFVNDKVPAKVDNALFALALDEKRPMFKPRQWSDREDNGTNVQQCAFVGCHSDVGGGVPDMALSTVPLLWMVAKIKEVSKAKFDETVLLQFMTTNRPPRAWFGRNHEALSHDGGDEPEGEETDASSDGMEGTNRANGAGSPRELDGQAPLANVPNRQRWRFLPKSRIQLKNFATSKGVIHESRVKWWYALHLVTFGRWHGKRGKLLDSGDDHFPLRVHFTANVLFGKLKCQLYKTHDYLDDTRQWKKTRGPVKFLGEDVIVEEERKLFWRWKQGVDSFHPREGADAESQELNDGDVNWTTLARGMGWDPPRGDVPDDAIISLIVRGMQERGYNQEE